MSYRRITTIATMALVFVLAGSAMASADAGNGGSHANQATVQSQERAGDRTQAQDRAQVGDVVRDRDRVQDRDEAPTADPVRDRVRTQDGVVDEPEQDRDRVRTQDGVVDEPEQDRDRVRNQDRPADLDIDRPTLRRCVNWLLENTDVDYGDNVRRWLWACHRLLAHFNQPL